MGTPTFVAITRRSTTSPGASSHEALTDRTSLGLVTQLVDDLGRGTDERKTSLLDLARELCVFGEETVSVGMKSRDARLRIIASQTVIGEMPYPG